MKKKMFIHFIMDESGSMSSSKKETIDGFNKYMSDQKGNDEVQILVSLTKFATNVEHVFYARAVNDVPDLNSDNYEPNGSTALLDAIGDAIKEADKSLVREKDSEYSFLFVVFTDGEENASHRYNYDQIKNLVKTKEDQGWKFVFFGTDIDAWSAADSIGFSANNTMKVARAKTSVMFSALSRSTHGLVDNFARGIDMSSSSVFESNLSDYDDIDKDAKFSSDPVVLQKGDSDVV